eukprot:14151009-Alexandrium_andersonii.AAC.1
MKDVEAAGAVITGGLSLKWSDQENSSDDEWAECFVKGDDDEKVPTPIKNEPSLANKAQARITKGVADFTTARLKVKKALAKAGDDPQGIERGSPK